MFLAKLLNDEIDNHVQTGNLRFAELKADLVAFQFMTDVEKDLLKQLKPPSDGVWEIRSRRLEPAIRVFGQFAERNILIATSCRYRADLGGFSNSEWKQEKRRVSQIFRQLFPCYSAKTAVNAHKLFDGALGEKHYDD